MSKALCDSLLWSCQVWLLSAPNSVCTQARLDVRSASLFFFSAISAATLREGMREVTTSDRQCGVWISAPDIFLARDQSANADHD
ncbi:hypothetical protein BV22DRAFT_1122100 [Leucogyrophana mollusca]|uniref:Uncharacterized protein n=1 Tax=Leucogyrophana mollusca TaxID=85980 RepID=A0ACB8B9B4_9AGAM|nr:hypothetical protein BV22DRAFT_1122100 [Leucogyrophana mollusca]